MVKVHLQGNMKGQGFRNSSLNRRVVIGQSSFARKYEGARFQKQLSYQRVSPWSRVHLQRNMKGQDFRNSSFKRGVVLGQGSFTKKYEGTRFQKQPS